MSSLIITVIGKIVVINGYIGNLDISTTNNEIFTLPDGVPTPNEAIRAVCNVGFNAYSADKNGYFVIGTDRKAHVSTSIGNATTFYVSCCYIAD